MAGTVSSQNQTGYGQADPYDSNSEFDAVDFMIRQRIAKVAAVKMVQVVAVHPGSGSPGPAGTVDVQILTNQLDGSGNATPNAKVYGIPFFRMQGGGWSITMDPSIGDVGMMACSDVDISALKKASANNTANLQVNPGSYRRNNISDGLYFGGFLNGKATKATFNLGSDGSLTITDGFSNIIKTSAEGISFTPAGGILKVVGQIQASGAIQAGAGGSDSVTLQSHTHPSNGAPPTPGT
jgi:hypothetical protein